MRYVTAFIWAALVWCVTIFIMGMLIGQLFDGIEGKWEIVPAIGVWATSLGIAALAFRSSLRQSRPNASEGGLPELDEPTAMELIRREELNRGGLIIQAWFADGADEECLYFRSLEGGLAKVSKESGHVSIQLVSPR